MMRCMYCKRPVGIHTLVCNSYDCQLQDCESRDPQHVYDSVLSNERIIEIVGQEYYDKMAKRRKKILEYRV